MKKITVLFIDDSALIRKLLSDIIDADARMEVVGAAVDAYDAREKIKQLSPDVLTLDIEMPKMNGLTFLRNLMRLRPMPVVMVSTLTEKGAAATLQSMEMGALDYVAKSVLQEERGLDKFSSMVVDKLYMASQANVAALASSSQLRNADDTVQRLTSPGIVHSGRIVAIGSSTGGTEALNQLLQVLPANSPPILVAQHIPPTFSASLAKRLHESSAMTVVEATDGLEVLPVHCYIAPGNFHLEIRRQGATFKCRVHQADKVNRHRPSVDVLFDAMVQEVGRLATGVILTGMGADGARGLLRMREAGCHTVGQNEASCVVYGMPRAAMELGGVEVELPLSRIAQKILQLTAVESTKVGS